MPVLGMQGYSTSQYSMGEGTQKGKLFVGTLIFCGVGLGDCDLDMFYDILIIQRQDNTKLNNLNINDLMLKPNQWNVTRKVCHCNNYECTSIFSLLHKYRNYLWISQLSQGRICGFES